MRLPLSVGVDGAGQGDTVRETDPFSFSMAASPSLLRARLAPHVAVLSAVAMFAAAIAWGTDSLSAREALLFVMALAPCVLVNAFPVVPIFTLRALRQRDITIRNICVLDRIADADTLVLDGAAALFAVPHLANPAQIGSRNMQIATSLGARSDDPLAKALYNMYGGKILDVEKLETTVHGTKAILEGRIVSLSHYDSSSSDLWLDVTGNPCVRFMFAIEPKPGAQAALASLKGDNRRVVFLNDTTFDLPVKSFDIEIHNTSKQKLLEELHRGGEKVLWVGASREDVALGVSDAFVSTSGDTAADAGLSSASLKPLVFLLSAAQLYERLLGRHVLIALTTTGLLLALAWSKALSVESGLSALGAFVIGLYLSSRQALQKGHPSVTA